MTAPRPDSSDLFARAAQAWGEGRQEAAAELLEALVESEPGHVVALNALGMIALNPIWSSAPAAGRFG